MKLKSRLVIFIFAAIITGSFWKTAFADDWKPVTPEEIALKQSGIDKDADAEGIFWDVQVADEQQGEMFQTILRHYIRIKIFNDRGREEHAQISIEYGNSTRISDIAGRTINPDGSIVELKKQDIFDKTVAKKGGLKLKAKSFAMPGVVPGSIIEYRWKETRDDSLANYLRLPFQRDIPIQTVTYHVKPFQASWMPFGMRYQPFHGINTPFTRESNGFYATSMKNVPAFREEPHMPPEYEVKPWILIYYTEDTKLKADKYWPKVGRDTFEKIRPKLKINDDVKKAAAEAVAGAATPDDKLRHIYDYCRSHIKNASFKESGVTQEERDKMKNNKSTADTLKRGIGDVEDIDELFAAMAMAEGFEVRYAMVPDRGDAFFDPNFIDSYFLKTYDIAVKVGDKWEFFDPGSYYVPYGMLRWQEEGEHVLLCDSKNSEFVATPLAGPEQSAARRTGHLKLDADGTIEGDLQVQYTGFQAITRREDGSEESPADREKEFTDEVKGQMGTAEVSDLKIENFDDREKPLVYKYHVKVPSYAVRTGKRLFVQPAFFEHGMAALFATADRKYPVYFHYPWSESDEVEIDLPPGYQLDHADHPGPLSAGNIADYKVFLGVISGNKGLLYKRNFFMGGGGTIIFPTSAYKALKQLFDYVHESDGHTITLKTADSGAN